MDFFEPADIAIYIQGRGIDKAMEEMKSRRKQL